MATKRHRVGQSRTARAKARAALFLAYSLERGVDGALRKARQAGVREKTITEVEQCALETRHSDDRKEY
jgi:hypothetical protein